MFKVFRGVAIVALGVGLYQSAHAGILNLPRYPSAQREHIAFATPTLAPLAFVKFCMKYPGQCRKPKMVFRGGPVKLTAERYATLMNVNRRVNVAIRPQANLRGVAGEEWIINPRSGDCNDYAVSKRYQLRALGWPSRALILSEVVTNWGEHHLVLVVRTDKGDLVMDSLTGAIRPWSKAQYQWVRAQLPGNPMAWRTLTAPRGASA
jgi:predicted transglutaminase-like cysteine proteinase